MRILPKRYAIAKMLSRRPALDRDLCVGLGSLGSFTPRRVREVDLERDLSEMRKAIDSYALDPQRPPQSLSDMVEGNYLGDIPIDPITREKDWIASREPQSRNPTLSVTGIADGHSASTKISSKGSTHNSW